MLDNDIVPRQNMDHNFGGSEELISVGPGTPANGGYFLAFPNCATAKLIRGKITQVARGPAVPPCKPSPTWGRLFVDELLGWTGTEIRWIAEDAHVTNKRHCDAVNVQVAPPDESGDEDFSAAGAHTGWFFNGGQDDQGFLYYYFRYLAKRGAIALSCGGEGCHNTTGTAGKGSLCVYSEGAVLELQQRRNNSFVHFTGMDFYHIAGRDKPWLPEDGLGIFKAMRLRACANKEAREDSKPKVIYRCEGYRAWNKHFVEVRRDLASHQPALYECYHELTVDGLGHQKAEKDRRAILNIGSDSGAAAARLRKQLAAPDARNEQACADRSEKYTSIWPDRAWCAYFKNRSACATYRAAAPRAMRGQAQRECQSKVVDCM